MTKLQILQSELNRLNTEIITDTGYTLRNKLRRISVITDTVVREAGVLGGGNPVLSNFRFVEVDNDGFELHIQKLISGTWETKQVIS